MRAWGVMGILALSGLAVAQATQDVYLYKETFDKAPPQNWRLPQGACKWTVERGVLHQEAVTPAYAPIYHMGHRSWTDFEVRLRLRIRKIDVHKGKPSMLNVEIWGVSANLIPGRLALGWRPPGAKHSKAVTAYDKKARVDPDRWYDIAVEYHPSRVTMSVDGRKLLECTEPPPRGTHQSMMMRFMNVSTEMDHFTVVEKPPLEKQEGAQ